MFDRILVPLDGSSFAEFALPLATAVARRSGGTVELASVQEPLPAYAFGGWEKDVESWRREYLGEVAARLEAPLDGRVDRTLLAGRVAQELEEHARSTAADLVVVSTHGRGPLSRFWLGSVADHLVRNAPCPVLLVRPREDDEPEADEVEFPVVLVPLDGSEEAEAVLGPAGELARLFGSRTVLARVVQYPAGLTSDYLPDAAATAREVVESGQKRAREYLEAIAVELRAEDRPVDVVVRVDTHPVSGIRNAAREHDAGLVALTTRGRGGVARTVLGSVADKLVRSSPVPVLVNRPPEE